MMSRVELICLYTISSKEIRRILRIWAQTLIPPAITSSLYFLIFGNIIGKRIGTMADYNYIDFIMPGLIVMPVMLNAYMNTSSSFYSVKFQRTVEEMLIAPIRLWVILLGYIIGGTVRGLLVGCIVLGVCAFFTDIQIQHPLYFICALFLTSFVFSLAGFLNGLYANSFDDVTIVPNFILTPLIYLGGVFYSAALLPSPFSIVAQFNPIFYVVSLMRYSMLDYAEINIGVSIGALCLIGLVLYLANLRLLNRSSTLRP